MSAKIRHRPRAEGNTVYGTNAMESGKDFFFPAAEMGHFDGHSAGRDPDLCEYKKKKVEIIVGNPPPVLSTAARMFSEYPENFIALAHDLTVITTPSHLAESDSIIFYSGEFAWGEGIQGNLIYRGEVPVFSSPVNQRKKGLWYIIEQTVYGKKRVDSINFVTQHGFFWRKSGPPYVTDDPDPESLDKDVKSDEDEDKLMGFIYN